MMKQLGPYRLEKLLGRGGMGSVYIGVHRESHQRAAIKVLSLTLADDANFRSRFEVEIETLKQLRHPNIVQILGDGEQDGHLFYAMELVEGKTLQELLQSGQQFTWRDVVGISVDICSALKHAHDSGVIHRDLKPANLLCAPDGSIKLTDFGIAKLFGATHRTVEGSVVGTADYMAPEQADGRPVTNRTDLYSLGAVMYTLLARRTPFQGGTLAQVIHKLKFEEVASLRRFNPQVPEALDQLIRELLRKDPQERVATALVLANRLRAMEHFLVAREAEEGESADSTPTRVAKPPQLDDGPTSVTDSDGESATQIGRTQNDQDSTANPDNFSWNEATVATTPPRPQQTSGEEVADDLYVVEEPVATPNRFTTVDEDQRIREARRKVHVEEAGVGWQSIAAIALALVAVIGVCIWGLWPPSADKLYHRIHATAETQTLADAWKDIEQFLERYPHDPRYSEIAALHMDVECDWLESRLRLRKRKTDGTGLEPYEQRWLEAYLKRDKEPEFARQSWQSILDEYSDQSNRSESLQTILTATEHQLKRLKATERSS